LVTLRGNLNPPEDMLPGNHICFYHRLFNPAAALGRRRPTGSTVMFVLRRAADSKISIRAFRGQANCLDHICAPDAAA